MSDDGPDSPEKAFLRRVSNLKQVGCNLLITGAVREEVSHQVTQKLLGAPEVPRTRILALTDQDQTDVPDLLPGDVGLRDERVHVVNHNSGTRSADAATSSASSASSVSSPSSTSSRARRNRQDLDELQTRICNEIATAKIAQSGFDPAELRVSLFTLSYLVNQHDITAIDRFVSAISDHVRGVSGIAHFHLPLPDDSKTVQRLSPLFDARIELREKHGHPEHRWHLPESDTTTSWFGL